MLTTARQFIADQGHAYPDWKALRRGPHAKFILAVIIANELRGLWVVGEAVRWMV